MAQYEIEVTAEQSIYMRSSQPNSVYKTDDLQLHFNYVDERYLVPIRFPYTAFFGKVIKSFKLLVYVNSFSRMDFYDLSIDLTGIYGLALPLNLDTLDYYSLQEIASKGKHMGSTYIRGKDASSWLKKYNELNIQYTSVGIEKVLYDGIVLKSRPGDEILLTLQSSRAMFPPKLVAVVQNATPIIKRLQPEEGYRNPREAVRLYWDLDSTETDVFGGIRQKSARVRWRKKGESSHHETTVQGSQWYCDIPANTFSFADSYFEWSVQATSTDNEESAASPWITIAIEDSHSTAQTLTPVGVYLEGNKPNTFSWKHIISTGTMQSGAELQTSANGTDWRFLKNVTGAVQQTEISANTLLGNTRFWRVRTQNSDGVAGSWSESTPIVVYAAPRPPAVTPPEGLPRITVTWQSDEQQAFEVSADSWKSGTVHGTTKIYDLPQWFSDGQVIVGVRVQSTLGLWSDWSIVRITVVNQPQEAVTLSARSVPHGVKLRWVGNHVAYTVYRDGLPILSTTDTECTDWLTTGRHRYQVRGINSRLYSLSNEVYEYSESRCGVISPIDNIDWLNLRFRSGASPETSAGTSRQVAIQYLAGRTKPVAEVSEQLTVEHSFEYSLANFGELERLCAMVGQTVICKSQAGPAVIGILTAVNDTSDWAGVDVSFTITETDYKEGGGLENH